MLVLPPVISISLSFSSPHAIPINLPWSQGLAGATYQNVEPQVIDDGRAMSRIDDMNHKFVLAAKRALEHLG